MDEKKIHPTRRGAVLRRTVATAAALAIAALLLHGVTASTLAGGDYRFPKYTQAAAKYLEGQLPPERMAADFSPLYLSLHVLARRLFPDPGLAVHALQIFLVAVSTVLLFFLLSRYFSYPVALGGALSLVMSRNLMIYGNVLEPETLLLFLLLGFSLCMTRSETKYVFLAGVLLALSILTRPNFLLLLAAVPVYFRLQGGKRRLWLRKSLVLAAPVVIAVLALAARNARHTGTFSPLVMNPGNVFFEGNNPLANGQVAVYPPLVFEASYDMRVDTDYMHVLYRVFSRRATGSELTVSEVNRYWSRKALRFIVDHPGHAAGTVARKAYHFWHGFLAHDIRSLYDLEERLRTAGVPSIPFSVVSALAFTGFVLGLKLFRTYFVFQSVLLLQLAVLLTTYVSARQKVAVIPFMAFFACVACEYLLKERRRLILGVATAAMVPFLHFETDAMSESRYLFARAGAAQELHRHAIALRGSGDLLSGAQVNAEAYAQTPWMRDYIRLSRLPFGEAGFAERALHTLPPAEGAAFSARFDRALLLIGAGRLSEADAELEGLRDAGHTLNRYGQCSPQVQFHLARTAALRGNTQGAVALLREALESNPGDPFSLAHMAVLSGEEKYRRRLFRYFDDIDASFFLGVAYLENGMAPQAIPLLSYVTSMLPEYRRAHFYLVAALGQAGNYEVAAALYDSARKRWPGAVPLEEGVLAALEGYRSSRPGDTRAALLYARALKSYGHYAKAVDALRKDDALRRDPEVRRELAEVEQTLRSLSGRGLSGRRF